MRSLLEDPKSCVGHPNRPARSANLSRMAVRSRCHSGVGRVGRGQPLGDGQPRGVRGAVGQPNDRGCSATWPGRGGGSALPASSRGLAVRAPQAAQYSRARGHVVGVVIEMFGCDACLGRRVVVILEPCVRAPLVCGFLSRAFGGWLLGLFKGVGDGFFQVHRLSLFPCGLVCRFVQRLGC